MRTYRQDGVSLTGLIIVLAVLGVLAVLALKILPTYTEYRAVKNAIVSAKAAGGNSAPEIRKAFDANATVAYITAISGSDLTIERVADGVQVSFAYEKKIPLVGPASLLLEYQGTTGTPATASKPE
jgi:Tfp pilus assembly protein PilE